jgi:D-amino-acid dehydrogenase
LGYKIPLQVKRGYHMSYAYVQKQRLNLPVIDLDNGFALSSMAKGTRLTTGIEFAHRDAKPSPRQLVAAEAVARTMLNLGKRQLEAPWMGSRPCTPDMRPVIGPAPNHKGLWFAFGHAHHGMTLGPVTGRVVAEMIAGEKTLVDLTPFSAGRFT